MVAPLAVMAAAGLPDRPGGNLRVRTLGWTAAALAWPFVLGALHLAPPTRDLLQAARAAGMPPACFRVMPSALVFYNHGPAPAFFFGRDTRFGGPQKEATFNETALRDHLLAGGCVLTEPRFLPDLARIAGSPPVTMARRGASLLVRAGPPPTRPRK